MQVNNSWTIGVIDDDSGLRTALTQLLRSAQFTPLPFESAEQFLRNADPQDLDALIVDLHLLGLNGLQLLATLEARGEARPAVLITGRDDQASRDLFRSWKGPVLFKPFDDTQLFAALTLVLGKPPIAA